MARSLIAVAETKQKLKNCIVCRLPKKVRDEIWDAWHKAEVRAAAVVYWLQEEVKAPEADKVTQEMVRHHINHEGRHRAKS